MLAAHALPVEIFVLFRVCGARRAVQSNRDWRVSVEKASFSWRPNRTGGFSSRAISLYLLLRFGLRSNFIDEGSFKARVLPNDEEFPELDLDLRSVEVPVSLRIVFGTELSFTI